MTIKEAVEFAEGKLGVVDLQHDAVNTNVELGKRYQDLSALEAEARNVSLDIDDAKASVFMGVLNSNPTDSVAAQERAVKAALIDNVDYQNLLRRQADILNKKDVEANEIRSLESRARLLAARMNMMGGYLQVLGSAKDGENITEIRLARNDGSPF